MQSESQSLLNSFFQILQEAIGVKSYLPDPIAVSEVIAGIGAPAIVLPFHAGRPSAASLPLAAVRHRQTSNTLGD